jgi:hypothetical protein
MRLFLLASGFLLSIAFPAQAIDARFERILKMLGPDERLEQLCDYTAMIEIRKGGRDFRPDRAVANAMADPKFSGDSIEVKGGAFRSRKKWYELSYSCTASSDHMTVVAFEYAVGAEIPETQWAGFRLWE